MTTSEQRIKIALQKSGRLTDHSLDLLARCGLKFTQSKDQLFCCARYSNTPAAVTEYLQISKGTASQSIQILQRHGLVLKRPDKQDGRIVRLRLSARGHRLVARLDELASWAQLPENIGTVALHATEKSLVTILRGLQLRNDYRSFGQCHTCHHFLRQDRTNFQCGLTGEDLQPEEILQICREHRVPDLSADRRVRQTF